MAVMLNVANKPIILRVVMLSVVVLLCQGEPKISACCLNFQNHQKYNKYKMTDKERKLFSLKGPEPEMRGSRSKLYKFMLEHMSDIQVPML